MEAKHTPGPWNVWDNDDNHSGPGCWYVVKHGDECVCEIYAIDEENPDTEKHEANARLISAAPELLEALQALMSKICVSCGGDDCRSACYDALLSARAAIAKAKGEA